MRKIILFSLMLFSIKTTAQVGINATGTAPASAAMLDVSSNSKGVLIPRMTTLQKNAIQNPVEGLMVYDTDVKQFSYCLAVFAGTAINCQWVNFGNTQVPATSWNVNGNDLSNANTGNVGIGIINPTLAKFQVVESNPNTPVHSAIWANNTSNGNGITSNAFNSGTGVWGTSGSGTGVEGRTTGSGSNSYGIFGNATGSGTGGYFYSASGNALVTGNGNVGIGNPAPTNKLSVTGNADFSGNVGIGNISPTNKLSVTGNSDFSGNVGIGTLTPTAKLEVAGNVKITGGSPSVGKILVSDADGLASWQSAELIHTIGEAFGGGIIFYVAPGGKHGLVAATQDQFQTSYLDRVEPTTDWYIAQDAANNPNLHNTEGKKFTDWKVPTRTELLSLVLQKSLIGGFLNMPYWSSISLSDNINARVVDFGYVTVGLNFFRPKNYGSCLRAIRSF